MKRYFKDMKTEEKFEIITKNEDLRKRLEEQYYEDQMEAQYEEGKLMLGERYNGVDIKDHYNSFFLVLRDWNKFIDNLDKDYLCTEGLELYDKIIELKKEHDNITLWEEEDEERYNELEEELENKCEELLSICEKQLHEYEKWDEGDFNEYIMFELDNNDIYSDYYIIDNDTSKVYEDVNFTRTYQ